MYGPKAASRARTTWRPLTSWLVRTHPPTHPPTWQPLTERCAPGQPPHPTPPYPTHPTRVSCRTRPAWPGPACCRSRPLCGSSTAWCRWTASPLPRPTTPPRPAAATSCRTCATSSPSTRSSCWPQTVRPLPAAAFARAHMQHTRSGCRSAANGALSPLYRRAAHAACTPLYRSPAVRARAVLRRVLGHVRPQESLARADGRRRGTAARRYLWRYNTCSGRRQDDGARPQLGRAEGADLWGPPGLPAPSQPAAAASGPGLHARPRRVAR